MVFLKVSLFFFSHGIEMGAGKNVSCSDERAFILAWRKVKVTYSCEQYQLWECLYKAASVLTVKLLIEDIQSNE